jgi:hypothetical protein
MHKEPVSIHQTTIFDTEHLKTAACFGSSLIHNQVVQGSTIRCNVQECIILDYTCAQHEGIWGAKV